MRTWCRLFSCGFYTDGDGSWRHAWWVRTPWFGILCFNGFAWKRNPGWRTAVNEWLFQRRVPVMVVDADR